MRLALLAAVLATAIPLAATYAAPTPVIASEARTCDFTVGALRLTALNDGQATRPNDGKTLSPVNGVTTALANAGLPTSEFKLGFGGLLVRDGSRIVLIDTGLGSKGGPDGGKLAAALASTGITPGQITDIVISHPHGDHVGGLVATDGSAAFPNARVWFEPAAWQALKANPGSAPIVAAIEPHYAPIAPDGRVAPGIRAVPIAGHTPGHIGVEIASGRARLLYIGDTMHHYVASVAAPDLDMAYDEDGPTAKASRKALLARAADQNLRLYAPHFPFPGLGTIRHDGRSYAWVPEAR